MATSDVEALIQGRASAQQHAYTTANVDKLMTFYTKDVDFTDVGKYTPIRSLGAFIPSAMSHNRHFFGSLTRF